MSSAPNTTTQQFLDIYDITNDVLILKNGTTAIILTVDAMNFGLLAEEEQDAIMYAYAGLLNSLNYPIQVVVQSKTKDVTGYLRKLAEQEEKTQSETIRKRIAQYRMFVANLIHERNVLDKRFYVSIPATSLEMGFVTTETFIPGKTEFSISDVDRSVIIEKATNLLEPKRDHLIAQFARIGLFSRQLTTQEIIQLFYVNYNPESTEGQEIAESSSYTSGLVHADLGEAYSNLPEKESVATTPTAPDTPSQPTARLETSPPSPTTTSATAATTMTAPEAATTASEPASPPATTNPTQEATPIQKPEQNERPQSPQPLPPHPPGKSSSLPTAVVPPQKP